MSKKMSFIIVISTLIVVIGVIALILISKRDDTPDTVEELQESLEDSEYSKCIKKVAENERTYENCVKEKLEAKGYTDGVDCIEDPNSEVCTGIEPCIREKLETMGYADGMDCIENYEVDPCTNEERYDAEVTVHNECLDYEGRYNAEVNVRNECDEEYHTTESLTEVDCLKLK